MKTLISLFVLIAMTAQTHASPSISMTTSSVTTTITIALDPSSAFTEKLVDALIKSPLVTERVNPWVAPATSFDGDGFNLNLANPADITGAVLRFELKNSELGGATVQDGFLRVSSRTGAFKKFHEALEASRSQHAITHNRPSRISRQPGEVAVLEGDFFGDGVGELNCTRGFRDFALSICDISVR